MKEAIQLLKEAHEVLQNYWFLEGEDDSYNNEDVIAIDERIEAFLERKGVK